MYPELDNAMQFRLDDIHEIKDHFIVEVHDRETMSKRPSRYIAAFDCVEKILFVLSGRKGSVSIFIFFCYCCWCTPRNNERKSWFIFFF